MDASRSKKLFTLGLAALFVVTMVPAPATAEVTGFDLGLEAALSDLELDLSAPVDEAVISERSQVAALSSAAVAEIWSSAEAVSAQSTGSSSSGDRKWWKKKKWWIPVVVAVVAGAALSGGDGDDTIDDGED